nr:hypothetical protein [Brevundimonas diminuta]
MRLTVIERGKATTYARKPRPADCYCCFDMAPGNKHVCPNCLRTHGARLPEGQRPRRPA